jgi:hypothetical protein
MKRIDAHIQKWPPYLQLGSHGMKKWFSTRVSKVTLQSSPHPKKQNTPTGKIIFIINKRKTDLKPLSLTLPAADRDVPFYIFIFMLRFLVAS